MRAGTTDYAGNREAAILARLLGDANGDLSPRMARYVLERAFSEADKARMHDLAVRNQNDALSPEEKQELSAYAKAGSVMAILKSRARRVITKLKKASLS